MLTRKCDNCGKTYTWGIYCRHCGWTHNSEDDVILNKIPVRPYRALSGREILNMIGGEDSVDISHLMEILGQ